MPKMNTMILEWNQRKKELEIDSYVSISERVGNLSYEVIAISKWNEKIDGAKKYLLLKPGYLDKNLGYAFTLVRDTGITLVSIYRSRPDIILEPGADWFRFSFKRLKVNKSTFVEALQSSAIAQKILGNPDSLKNKIKKISVIHSREKLSLLDQLQSEKIQNAELSTKKMTAEQEIQTLRRQVNDLNIKNRDLKDAISRFSNW